MKGFQHRALDIFTALSFFLCLGVISLWIAFGNGLHHVAWIFLKARWSVFIDRGSIGGSIVPHWPNRGLALTWIAPGVYLPLLPLIVFLAMPLRWRLKRWLESPQSDPTAIALKLPLDICWLCLLLATSAWFVVYWLPTNLTDDAGVQAGGAASVILLVSLLWLAAKFP